MFKNLRSQLNETLPLFLIQSELSKKNILIKKSSPVREISGFIPRSAKTGQLTRNLKMMLCIHPLSDQIQIWYTGSPDACWCLCQRIFGWINQAGIHKQRKYAIFPIKITLIFIFHDFKVCFFRLKWNAYDCSPDQLTRKSFGTGINKHQDYLYTKFKVDLMKDECSASFLNHGSIDPKRRLKV